MALRKLKSGCNKRPGGTLQLGLRQYSERPSGPLIYFLASQSTFIYLTLNKPTFYLPYINQTIFLSVNK